MGYATLTITVEPGTLTRIRTEGACRTDPNYRLYDNDEDYYEPPSGVRCPRCPVMKDCLEWALVYRELGVWGGTTERQRRALERPHSRVHCPACGGTDVERIALGEVCIDCGTSWLT